MTAQSAKSRTNAHLALEGSLSSSGDMTVNRTLEVCPWLIAFVPRLQVRIAQNHAQKVPWCCALTVEAPSRAYEFEHLLSRWWCCSGRFAEGSGYWSWVSRVYSLVPLLLLFDSQL